MGGDWGYDHLRLTETETKLFLQEGKHREMAGHFHFIYSFGRRDGHLHSSFSSLGDGEMATSILTTLLEGDGEMSTSILLILL